MSTDPKFLDPDPIAEPRNGDELFPVDEPMTGLTATSAHNGPCADCTRYAQVGYVISAAVGITAGVVVAYVILRNRLAPNG